MRTHNIHFHAKIRKKITIVSINIFLEVFIKKTYPYNFDSLKPHFYIIKLEFAGVYIIFSYFC